MLVLTDSDPSIAIMSSEPPVVPGSSGGPNVQCLTPGPGRDFPHSPSMAPSFPRHLQPSGGPCTPQSGPASQQHHQWDINDNSLPMPSMYDPFELWPSGHYRRVYRGDSDDARRHVSGWAMRNTNNHNALILKKSCLGVLVCSRDCLLESGQKVHLRPAICDKARRKQIGKSCPNPGCTGKLELLSCRGHCGYPVTHFWRHVNNSVYFQAKGYHDHPRPEVKSLSEKGRQSLTKQLRHSGGRFLSAPTKRRFPILTTEDIPDRNIFMPAEDEVMCSCPPFECVCPKSAPRPNFIPSSLGYFKETPPHTFLPHRSSPHPVSGMESLPHGPFTQINITNTCVPPTSVDVNIPGIEIYQNFPRLGHHNHFYDPDMKMLRYGNNEDSSSSVPHNQSLHKNPEDDFRSLNIHSSSSSISLQNSCTSRTFDNGTSISTLSTRADARDSYDKYKSYGGHILSKHRTNQVNTEERFQCLNRSLKPEPVDNVFSSSPTSSCAEDLSRPFPADSLYDQVSPAFSEQPMRSPTLLEARSKFDHPHDDNNKEQHQQDGQQTPTYITLTPSQGSVEGRELHSCRLGHMNKSPNTVPSSLDSFLCPPSAALPTKVETMGTPPTSTFPRHHSSRDHISNTSPSPMRLTSPCMPRLVLEDNESPGDSLRNSAINLSTQTHHDPSITPFSLNNDIPAPPYPPPGTACGNTPSVPYGFYCNDIFQSPSQQAYRNHSINITLTYN